MRKKLFSILSASIITCIMVSLLCINCLAASSATISLSSSSVKVGSTVTATVKFSSDGKSLGGVDSHISYDNSILEFVHVESVPVFGSGGKLTISDYAQNSSVKTFSYSIKFKSKKAGSSTIKVYDTTLYDYNEDLLGNPSSSVTVTVKGAESLSSNANLKSVSIPAGTLSPSFSPSTTSYKVTVENSVTSFPITANTADSKASVNVSGSKSLKVGENTRKVTVTAENGTTKTYTFVITRLAANNNEEVTTPNEETTKPIENTEPNNSVTVNGETFYIVKDLTNVSLPANFTLTPFSYNGTEIPSVHSDLFSMTLIYLAKEDGSSQNFYVYDEGNDIFTPFVSLTSSAMTYIILTPDSTVTPPSGFTPSENTMIENQKVVAWVSDQESLSQFYLVYAMNSDGEIGFYLYDTVEKTIQRFVYVSADSPISGIVSPNIEEPANFIEKVFNKISQNKVLFLSIVLGICALCVIIAIISIISAVVFRKKVKREYNMELE